MNHEMKVSKTRDASTQTEPTDREREMQAMMEEMKQTKEHLLKVADNMRALHLFPFHPVTSSGNKTVL